ncbi:hypothetical protein M422DRAFT_101727, partial [Sphaerobolus stellatus SS14]
KLPAEVLEFIVNNICEVNDLLSLALTSRTLYALIIPWHIDYRWISCRPGRTNLWRTLTTKSYLAARVRKLEVFHRYNTMDLEVIPSSL